MVGAGDSGARSEEELLVGSDPSDETENSEKKMKIAKTDRI